MTNSRFEMLGSQRAAAEKALYTESHEGGLGEPGAEGITAVYICTQLVYGVPDPC